MTRSTVIGVLGATGFTGALIARRLYRDRVPCLLASRSAAKLARLCEELGGVIPTRVTDFDDPASLRAFASQVDVLINCAGPYTDCGAAVIEAALDAGVHMLDLNGEQPFLQRILAQFDGPARRRGLAIATAMGVEGAIADCGAALASAALDSVDEIIVGTTARDFHTTQGTRLSRMRLLTRENWAYEDGGWRASTLMWPRSQPVVRRFHFAPPVKSALGVWLPSVALLTIPLHIQVRRVTTYFVVNSSLATMVRIARPAWELLRLSPLAWLVERIFDLDTHDPGADHVHATFQVLVEARGMLAGQPAMRRVLASGRDPYGLSADMITQAAQWLGESGPACGRGGVLAPALAFDPRRLLTSLASSGMLLIEDGAGSGSGRAPRSAGADGVESAQHAHARHTAV